MVVERRKYIRFLAQPNTYAALGSRFTKVGRVKDISLGGMAFEYICNPEDTAQANSKIAIFLSGDGFYLSNLPCRVVFDLATHSFNKNLVPNTIYAINRCGVQFTATTENQKVKLEYFLKHHTRGLAASSFSRNFEAKIQM